MMKITTITVLVISLLLLYGDGAVSRNHSNPSSVDKDDARLATDNEPPKVDSDWKEIIIKAVESNVKSNSASKKKAAGKLLKDVQNAFKSGIKYPIFRVGNRNVRGYLGDEKSKERKENECWFQRKLREWGTIFMNFFRKIFHRPVKTDSTVATESELEALKKSQNGGVVGSPYYSRPPSFGFGRLFGHPRTSRVVVRSSFRPVQPSQYARSLSSPSALQTNPAQYARSFTSPSDLQSRYPELTRMIRTLPSNTEIRRFSFSRSDPDVERDQVKPVEVTTGYSPTESNEIKPIRISSYTRSPLERYQIGRPSFSRSDSDIERDQVKPVEVTTGYSPTESNEIKPIQTSSYTRSPPERYQVQRSQPDNPLTTSSPYDRSPSPSTTYSPLKVTTFEEMEDVIEKRYPIFKKIYCKLAGEISILKLTFLSLKLNLTPNDLRGMAEMGISGNKSGWVADSAISAYLYALSLQYKYFAFNTALFWYEYMQDMPQTYEREIMAKLEVIKGKTHYACPIAYNNHWMIVLVRLDLQEYYVLTSGTGTPPAYVYDNISYLMELIQRKIGRPDATMTRVSKSAEKQYDAYSCGVFVSWYAKRFVQNQDFEDYSFIADKFRIEMFNEIVPHCTPS